MNEFAALTGNIFVQVDPLGNIRDISSNHASELGFEGPNLIGTPWLNLLEDDPSGPWGLRAEKALNELETQECQITLKHPATGAVRYRCKMKYGKEAHMFFLAIRKLSKSEEKLPIILQKTLDQLNISLKTANMGVWEALLTADKNAMAELKWDAEMCRMHGVPQGTSVDVIEWFLKALHPEDWPELQRKHQEHISCPENSINHLTYRVVWPNGEVHFIDSYGSMKIGTGDVPQMKMYGVAKDITEDVLKRKLLEDQKNSIVANSRITVLGEISGGIAHEINNPLTVIQARSFQLMQMQEQNNLEPAKVKAIAESISKTCDKIAKIIKSIRAFAQSQENTPFDLVSIEELIEETLDFCKVRFYNHGITIKVAPLPENLEIECRLIQIEEVLLNLFNNAHDAIVKLTEKWICIESFDKDSAVEIHITDSGPGIPEAVADQMMLPFFTTKGSGKGTGLGLSIAAEIVHSHHGEILLDRTSQNTRFILRFPKHQPH